MNKKQDDARQAILFIEGHEPLREGEYPAFFKVGEEHGQLEQEVAEITHRYEHRGDHGIGWYDVWTEKDGKRQLRASMNERAVATVGYEDT